MHDRDEVLVPDRSKELIEIFFLVSVGSSGKGWIEALANHLLRAESFTTCAKYQTQGARRCGLRNRQAFRYEAASSGRKVSLMIRTGLGMQIRFSSS